MYNNQLYCPTYSLPTWHFKNLEIKPDHIAMEVAVLRSHYVDIRSGHGLGGTLLYGWQNAPDLSGGPKRTHCYFGASRTANSWNPLRKPYNSTLPTFGLPWGSRKKVIFLVARPLRVGIPCVKAYIHPRRGFARICRIYSNIINPAAGSFVSGREKTYIESQGTCHARLTGLRQVTAYHRQDIGWPADTLEGR